MIRRAVFACLSVMACSGTPVVVTPVTPPPLAVHSHERAAEPLTDREKELVAHCGTEDAHLVDAARWVARQQATAHERTDPGRLSELLRSFGSPHPRPHLILATGSAPLPLSKLADALDSRRTETSLCGLAFAAEGAASEVFAAISVVPLATLDPLPKTVRSRTWVTMTGRMLTPAKSATLFILGPSGSPRPVAATIDPTTKRFRSVFSLEQSGTFELQLLAEIGGGPTPVLETEILADVTERSPRPAEAPGETAGLAGETAESLFAMIDALRTQLTLPRLVRDARLDALAHAHAKAMQQSSTVAHDVGNGELDVRFHQAGHRAKRVGENVARTRSVRASHRALYESPSHRLNLTNAEYTHVGVGIAQDSTGNVYVCEVFASHLR